MPKGRNTLTVWRRGTVSSKTSKGKTSLLSLRNQVSVSNVNPPGQQSLEECIGGSDSTKSEIVWILNSVVCGLSARNSDNMGNVFAVIFPESKIAKNFFLGRIKCGYRINHDFGLYFKGLTILRVI